MADESELAFLPATELAAAIRSGDVSPVEAVDDLLARIEASQPALNAFITVCADDARAAAARAADAACAVAKGGELGPLHGVPVSVKDLINTAGVRTTFGSRLMEDNVPGADAVAVARLKAAGAIVVGKTTTPEFAHKLLTDAPLFGTTRNPWNPDYTPGGSSGGSAAAVAAGLGPLSLTTDAGASTRQPAACCGIVGMKPTLGRLPHNQVPDGFANFIHLGVMARTVADAALMLGVMAGPDGSDPFSLAGAPGRPGDWAVSGDAVRGKRLAWRALLGNEALDGEVRTLCEHAVETLGGLGAEVEAIDDAVENAEPTWRVLQQSNWAARFGKDVDANEERMDPSFVAGIREGGKYSGTQLQQAMYKRTQIFRTVQGWFGEFDFIVTPTLSRPPLKVEHKALEPIKIEGADAGDMRAAWVSYLNIFNLTGHPAVSVPCGWTAGGLPVGLQIVGRWQNDAGVLAAAAALEEARPWAERRPAIR